MSSPQASGWRFELRALWVLALPLVFVQLGNQLKGVVDTAVVGRLGATELAAVGLANIVFYAFFVIGEGTVLGVDPHVSQALGAGKPTRARAMLWQGIWLAIAGAVFVLVLIALAPAIFAAFDVPPDVAAEATTYIRIRAIGVLPSLIFVALRCYLQARSRTGVLIWAMVGANVINLMGTLLLVHGGEALPAFLGPLRAIPAMGVAGSAIATVASTFIQLLIVVVVFRDLPVKGWERRMRRAIWSELRRALSVGVPVGLQMLAEVGVFALAGLLAGNIGAVPLAAHQVALTLASVTFTMCIGLANATSVRVGKNIGAGNREGARRAGLVSFASALGLMSVPLLLFTMAPRWVSSLMTDEADVIAATVSLLAVAAIFQLTDGLQAVGAGTLRGAGDTRFSFVANVCGHYLIGLPVAVVCAFAFDLGVIGLWWGLAAGLSAVGFALLGRFLVISRRPMVAL
jgi:multidrug resistance protein, MATE family